ncbi:copper resistance D family protein [Solibacillus sp. FSL K6-1523]|uniref:copper resistance D family protein n=1 Tax=Solibacillus sp. FSL K6-1523 TaxID=2921471 RepID=UPI0030FA3CF2
MIVVTILSQFILYVSLSILMGAFIMRLIPTSLKPEISIPARWIYVSLWSIPIVTFAPILQLLVILTKQFGLFPSLLKIITNYQVGHSWLASAVLTLILAALFTVSQKRVSHLFTVIYLFLLTAIIAAIAFASHAHAMGSTTGFFLDFIHLFAISVWVGILLQVSFFAISYENWEVFLKWFSPTAIVAVTAMALSGIFLTETIVPDYITGWSSPYGHWLFMKHVLLIPLVCLIFANGVLIKLQLTKPNFNPTIWTKIEAVLLLLIVLVTAIFSEHQPPMPTAQSDNLSLLMQWMLSTPLETGMMGHFQMNGTGVIFFILTAVFIGLFIVSFIKRAPLLIPILLCLAIAICFYMGMMSITVFDFTGKIAPHKH